ncbi:MULTISPECIES: MDR family MFS transporter [Bacillus]|uniref:Multidrug resistance protein MdtH n=2 Tax=Bacillus amyloliquefaciens group TaxID=1938374 RepID=A0A7W4QH18_BACVE|nr:MULTISPECIES: MFS transporter [Bacillus]AMQ73112.1 MFS transporter [Bacillus amyloliquefaciens UMAF6614]AWM46938.1 MFS transporter [Bacillus amyloliquefaciens]AWQ15953.1 MFS transporter [Bacillus velezensis]KAF6535147.1 MFS transporter [Bacillus sp. EKM208B]MBF6668184.1 MFS transporter [Bacillus velezensis]
MKGIRLRIHPVGWNIILGTLFSRMSVSMSIPFLSIYLTQVKGVSPALTGIIVSVSSLAGIVMSFYGGYLSDLFGRKIVMITSVFCWALVFVSFMFADSVLAFFVINALNGLCQSIFEPASRALLSDISKEENRLKMFNLRYTAINIGVVFGPLLGLRLGAAKTALPFLFAGFTYFLYGLSLVFSFRKFKLDENNRKENKTTIATAFNVTRKDKVFLITLLGVILSISGYAHFSTTLPQYFAAKIEDGVTIFSWLLALNAIVVLIVQYPIVNIMKKFPPIHSIILGNALISFSLLFFSLSSNPFIWGSIVVFFTIGEVLIFSMVDMLVDEIAKPGFKGTYFGAAGFNRLGNVIGPWLGGILLSFFGVNGSFYMFLIIFITTASGIPVLFLAKKHLDKSGHSKVDVTESHRS